MGLGDLVGKALTSFGLGQSDLIEVTNGVLSRINRYKKTSTEAERDAMAFALDAMIDELRDRDVATAETAKQMHDVVAKWLR